MNDRQPFTFSARLRSFTYAWRGFRTLILREHNARLHALATLLVVVAGISLRVGLMEWALLALAVATVWSAEAFNAAIESLADGVAPEPHPLVGQSKDLAAAAVLMSAVGSAAIGVCVLGPRLLAVFAP